MKRFATRLLLAGTLAAAALYPVYLLAGNWYLRSGELERRLNRRPERLLVQAGTAWTLWPGVIHVRGFRIRNQTRSAQWWAAMERGSFRLRLLDLRRRELLIDGLSGRGVSFRLRRRLDGREWGRPPRPRLQPAIPGLANPPRRPPEEIYPPRLRRDPWRIRISGVELDEVREIWIDEVRFAGRARLAGGFEMTVWQRLQVAATRLEIAAGAITLGAGPAARPVLADASGRIDARVTPYSPAEHRGWRAFGFLSGRAAVEGTVHSLGFLDVYLKEARWLTLEAEQGRLAAHARIRRGQLLAGSRVEVRPERLAAAALDYQAGGSGRLLWEVLPGRDAEGTGSAARLAVTFDRFAVTRRGHRQPHVRGRGLRIEALGDPPRLIERDLFSLRRIDIRIPAAEVPDLAFYNAYLPASSGLELTGGSGRLSAGFRAAAPEWIGTGRLRLDATGVSARFEGRPLRGDLSLRTHLRSADLRGRRFDISGTRLDLTRVGSPDEPQGRAWWARAHLDRAVLEPGAPIFLRAQVESTLSDPRPLFSFMAPAQRGPVLRWVDRLLNVQGVGAVAELAVGDGAVVVEDLAIAGGKASIQGRLRFGGAPRSGVLYAAYGRWDVGVELDGKERNWKLMRPRKWYESRTGPAR